jgi:uncharacterized membrane protein YkvA (DUF1232 family)
VPNNQEEFADEFDLEAIRPDEHFKNSRENEEIVKKGFWEKVKGVAGKIPFVKDAVAMYYCSIDIKTPLAAKGIAFGALAYFILPADAIPDTLAALGFVDDAAVITTVLTTLGSNVTDEHKEQSKKFFHGDIEGQK